MYKRYIYSIIIYYYYYYHDSLATIFSGLIIGNIKRSHLSNLPFRFKASFCSVVRFVVSFLLI